MPPFTSKTTTATNENLARLLPSFFIWIQVYTYDHIRQKLLHSRFPPAFTPKRPRINLTPTLLLHLTINRLLPKNHMPTPLEHPARKMVIQLRLNQIVPKLDIFIPRPPPHRLPRHDELRTARGHQILGSRAPEPIIPQSRKRVLQFRLHALPKRFPLVREMVFAVGGAVVVFEPVV